MSEKFLEQVESLMPDDALDNIIEGKRALQRFLSNKGVKNVAVKQFKDEMTFTLDDGSQVVVEVTDYKKVDGIEDGEVSPKKLDAMSTILNVKTPKIAIPGSVASQVKKTQKAVLSGIQQDLNS